MPLFRIVHIVQSAAVSFLIPPGASVDRHLCLFSTLVVVVVVSPPPALVVIPGKYHNKYGTLTMNIPRSIRRVVVDRAFPFYKCVAAHCSVCCWLPFEFKHTSSLTWLGRPVRNRQPSIYE